MVLANSNVHPRTLVEIGDESKAGGMVLVVKSQR